MDNNLMLLNIKNYNTKCINELKYQVHNSPKKYASKTAKAVESVFIEILLKSMRQSLLQNDLLENDQSRLYTDIYDQQISKEMTKKGIGLAKIILKQIKS